MRSKDRFHFGGIISRKTKFQKLQEILLMTLFSARFMPIRMKTWLKAELYPFTTGTDSFNSQRGYRKNSTVWWILALHGVIFLPQHQWRTLDHFPWWRYAVNLQRSLAAAMTLSLENLALWVSPLIVSSPSWNFSHGAAPTGSIAWGVWVALPPEKLEDMQTTSFVAKAELRWSWGYLS